MIARLYYYFGIVGVASVAGWLAALLILVLFARSRRRTVAYPAAFGLSLVALALATLNSSYVSDIQVDRSAEALPPVVSEPPEEEPPPAEPMPPALRFAEETRDEARDDAGKKATTRDEPEEQETPPRYAYREGGKQKREEGKQRELTELKGLKDIDEDLAVRTMPEADVIRADRLDRLNLFVARLVPWLVLLFVAYDYLSRFNKTIGYVCPLPIASRLVDSLFPKTRAVQAHAASPGDFLRHLEDLVRKGETFLLLAPQDPWPTDRLHRLRVRRLRLWPFRLTLRNVRLWPLTKITYAAPDQVDSATFIFDGLWFGRYCFVATHPDTATQLLRDLVVYLETMHVTHAATRRTVNVVWAFDQPPPHDLLDPLVYWFRECNFKLVVASPEPCLGAAAPPFDEQIDLTLERTRA